jgi:hypothetical protein
MYSCLYENMKRFFKSSMYGSVFSLIIIVLLRLFCFFFFCHYHLFLFALYCAFGSSAFYDNSALWLRLH